MTTWLSINATPPWTARPDLNEAMLRCGTRAQLKRCYSAPSSDPIPAIVEALLGAVDGLTRRVEANGSLSADTNLFVAGEDALLGSAPSGTAGEGLPVNFVTVELRPGQSQPVEERGLSAKADTETLVVEVVARSRAGGAPWAEARRWAFACYDAIIALG